MGRGVESEAILNAGSLQTALLQDAVTQHQHLQAPLDFFQQYLE